MLKNLEEAIIVLESMSSKTSGLSETEREAIKIVLRHLDEEKIK